MFSDIRGFTSLAESQPPEETIELLNTYYTLMFDAISGHGGVVNQMIGDGLMAIFGAPLPLPDHGGSAVRAALEMIELIELFNVERDRRRQAADPDRHRHRLRRDGRRLHRHATSARPTRASATPSTSRRGSRRTPRSRSATILIDAATRAALRRANSRSSRSGPCPFKGKAVAVEVFSPSGPAPRALIARSLPRALRAQTLIQCKARRRGASATLRLRGTADSGTNRRGFLSHSQAFADSAEVSRRDRVSISPRYHHHSNNQLDLSTRGAQDRGVASGAAVLRIRKIRITPAPREMRASVPNTWRCTMKSLSGTKTHDNLKAAFAGESQANRRYLYFANKADVEGQNDVAALFRSTAEGETGHAHGHLEYLEQVGDPATGSADRPDARRT